MPIRLSAVAAAALLTATSVTGCGGSANSSSSGGELSYCSEISDPPAEFYAVTRQGTANLTHTPAGADIDIARQVAKRLGKTATFTNIDFDQLIPSLRADKCNAIISFMNNTATRRKQVAFVDYLQAGQSLLFRKGSAGARSITTLDELYGRTVSTPSGTTEASALIQANRRRGTKPPITIRFFPTTDDAVYALTQGTVDACFEDTPTMSYVAAHNPALVLGPQVVAPVPIGIALRKGDPLIPKVEHAVKAMYADGSMQQVLATWGFSRFALRS